MTVSRTAEQDAVYKQFVAEATAMVVEMNRRVSEQANKETTFCSVGCTFCCNQIFTFQLIEFEVIYNRIVNDPELRVKFEKQNQHRKALIAEYSEELDEITRFKSELEFKKWISRKIPCSLLWEGKCLVYDVRPSACSTYLTLSPPRICAVDPRVYLSTAMARIKNEFGTSIRRLNDKYGIRTGENLFNLSWHLDNTINFHQIEKKEKV